MQGEESPVVRPRSLPATAPVTPVIFPALAVTPAFPPWVPGSNSAQYRALSRFKFPSPTPLLPKSTDQLSPASPIPCLHSPKQRHFLPGPKTFFLPWQRDQARNQVSRYLHPLRPAPRWRAPSFTWPLRSR